jgi:molybdopterin-guanine dinucleotide biosynthesis protein B
MILAIASDKPVPGAAIPCVNLDDIAAVAEVVLASAQPLATVVETLTSPRA